MAAVGYGPGRVLSVGNIYPPHDFAGGYELLWRGSVTQLRGRGHTVRVLVSEYRSPALDPGFELDDDVHRDLRWYWRDHDFPRRSLRERLDIERHNAGVLEHHLRELEPDAVAWWGMGGMSLSLIERVRRAGIPAIGVVGDEWMEWGFRADRWLAPLRRSRFPGITERMTGLPARVDLDPAATWLFMSAAVRDRARAAGWGLPGARVVPPGIDDELFKPADPERWGWRLLYLGRIEARKGVHVAVESLAHLPVEATLVLQGNVEERYRDELLTRARALEVEDRVTFSSGPRQSLPRVYAAADAVLFPVQWEEPWGLVPLEAMAVGRPVVASGTGGSREYLRHEENALVYEPRDSVAALAAAVLRLADDAELRGRIREAGFETAARYTQRRYNDAIAEALKAAAGEAR